MTERERLADLIDDYMSIEGSFNTMDMAEYLLSKGVIVPSVNDSAIVLERHEIMPTDAEVMNTL